MRRVSGWRELRVFGENNNQKIQHIQDTMYGSIQLLIGLLFIFMKFFGFQEEQQKREELFCLTFNSYSLKFLSTEAFSSVRFAILSCNTSLSCFKSRKLLSLDVSDLERLLFSPIEVSNLKRNHRSCNKLFEAIIFDLYTLKSNRAFLREVFSAFLQRNFASWTGDPAAFEVWISCVPVKQFSHWPSASAYLIGP